MKNTNTKEFIKAKAWIIGIIMGILTIIIVYASRKNTIDLTGNWEMTFKVNKSNFNSLESDSLEYKYRIFLIQNVDSIEGNGEKYWESSNGTETFYNIKQKSLINISGNVLHDKIIANIFEMGIHRETFGVIEFEPSNDLLVLQGKFNTNAENSSGIATLKKIED